MKSFFPGNAPREEIAGHYGHAAREETAGRSGHTVQHLRGHRAGHIHPLLAPTLEEGNVSFHKVGDVHALEIQELPLVNKGAGSPMLGRLTRLTRVRQARKRYIDTNTSNKCFGHAEHAGQEEKPGP